MKRTFAALVLVIGGTHALMAETPLRTAAPAPESAIYLMVGSGLLLIGFAKSVKVQEKVKKP